MTVLITILLVILGFIVLLLIIALLTKKEHYVKCEIVINAPVQKVYGYLKLLKNQDAFNEHAKAGAEREKNFKGTDGAVGYVYAWKGDKNAGEGEKEIISLVENKKVETEIRFIKPMKVSSRVIMETEALSEHQTKVSWSNAGKLNVPFNLFIPTMEKSLPKAMEASLNNLKTILENK